MKSPFPQRPIPLSVASAALLLRAGVGGRRGVIVGAGAVAEARVVGGRDLAGHPPAPCSPAPWPAE